jgi:hypothetical protein
MKTSTAGDAARNTETPRYPGMPRWFKVLGLVVLAGFVLLKLFKLTLPGSHGSHGFATHDLPAAEVHDNGDEP